MQVEYNDYKAPLKHAVSQALDNVYHEAFGALGTGDQSAQGVEVVKEYLAAIRGESARGKVSQFSRDIAQQVNPTPEGKINSATQFVPKALEEVVKERYPDLKINQGAALSF